MLGESEGEGLAKYLAPRERVVLVTRRHGVVLTGAIIAWVGSLVIAAVMGALAGNGSLRSVADKVAAGLVLAASLLLAWRALKWWVARYVVTDRRVLLVEGIFSRNVAAIPLSKVTDTTFHRSFWGRLFGYGDLMLDAPGEGPGLPILTRVPHPDQMYRIIVSMVVPGEPGGRGGVSMEGDTGPFPRLRF